MRVKKENRDINENIVKRQKRDKNTSIQTGK